jgi:hypothetical protein
MSAKVRASTAYRLLFCRTVHPLLRVHFLFFLTDLCRHVFFSDRWKLSYMTPIFKKGRRKNVEHYRGVAILSAIPKRFELLVYSTTT